jgi:hypothetical protein
VAADRGSFYAPCVDGDYDQGVIGHEFGHMIENRMIGKGEPYRLPRGCDGRGLRRPRLDRVPAENGYDPSTARDPFATGTYATGNKEHGIRNYVMNYPRTGAFPTPSTYAHVNPLNFSDIGLRHAGQRGPLGRRDLGRGQQRRPPGADRQVQRRFPAGDAKLQAQCAAGELPSQNCPATAAGSSSCSTRCCSTRWHRRWWTPATRCSRPTRCGTAEPTRPRSGARSHAGGFGNAAAITRVGRSDTQPGAGLRVAARNNALVTFSARLEGDRADPVVGNVYVGHYEKQVNPIADTDPATTNSGHRRQP